jgi:hypothetical protein
MKRSLIIGFTFVTLLSGCASTSGSHAHGEKAGLCPMEVPGTTVVATEIEGGSSLAFSTTTGDVQDLRNRVRRMSEMHGQGGMMKSPGMMPAVNTSAEDIVGGAQIILHPKNPVDLGALREHVAMKATRMASGECPMKMLGREEPPVGN